MLGSRRNVLPPQDQVGLLVDLDAERYQDPLALFAYAHDLLIAANEPSLDTPYRHCDNQITNAIAKAIAGRATSQVKSARSESFLLAQLLARAMRARAAAVDVQQPEWQRALPESVGAAFDEELGHLGSRAVTARTLLKALAWARGPGLPWPRIWVPVANALGRLAGSTPDVEEKDVRWLLEVAGAYVVEDLGPGRRSAFRPFHELLSEHLRADTNVASQSADRAERDRIVEEAITRALMDTIPVGAHGMRDWEHAHPYVHTYLAQHGHAAGPAEFADLVGNPDFLAVADPVPLTPLLTPTSQLSSAIARTYRRARPQLGGLRDAGGYV